MLNVVSQATIAARTASLIWVDLWTYRSSLTRLAVNWYVVVATLLAVRGGLTLTDLSSEQTLAWSAMSTIPLAVILEYTRQHSADRVGLKGAFPPLRRVVLDYHTLSTSMPEGLLDVIGGSLHDLSLRAARGERDSQRAVSQFRRSAQTMKDRPMTLEGLVELLRLFHVEGESRRAP
jgi:hypothetical protein